MPLVLQIENIDRLPDGGPVRIVVGPQGCQVGRNATMHWVLPDPSRMISGHHFDITFAEGGWWLTDRSTNGTFLQGSRYRLDQPYRLRHLDRFQAGHYLIVAQIDEPAAVSPGWSTPVPAATGSSFAATGAAFGMAAIPPAGGSGALASGYTGGVWNLPGDPPAAVPPAAAAPGFDADPWSAPSPGPGSSAAAFPAAPYPAAPYPAAPPAAPYPAAPGMAPAGASPSGYPAAFAPASAPAYFPQPAPVPSGIGRMPGQPGDFGDDFIATPQAPGAGQPVFAPPPPAADPPPSAAAFAAPALPEPPPLAAAFVPALPATPAPAAPAAILRPPTLAPNPTTGPTSGPTSGPPAETPGLSQPPQALPGAQPIAPLPPGSAQGQAVVAAFCAGAGLDPSAFAQTDPEALAQMLGRSLRMVSSEVMTQLQLRAAAKQFTRGGDRTMRQAEHNNPLKFLPDVEQALEAMFLRPRAGFLQGPEALHEALLDLRHHQVALFAALQPALTQLLGDLAPEAVEAAAGGGLLGGGRKAKAWDTFVERWDAKTAPHENGLLDAFLQHFAAAYIESVAQQGHRGPG